MKKHFLLTLFLIAFNYVMLAQNLTLSNSDGDVSNAEITISDTTETGTILSYIYVTNNSSGRMSVKVKKYVLTTVEGAEDVFCWGNCFPPSTTESPEGINIEPGNTNNEDFHAEYMPDGNNGECVVAYTFFNESNPDDSVMVTVTFDFERIPAGINDNISAINILSNAFPNPAKDYTSFNFKLNPRSTGLLIVRNILGKEIERHLLDQSGYIRLNTGNYLPGAYIYSFIVDEKVLKTRKLLVTR